MDLPNKEVMGDLLNKGMVVNRNTANKTNITHRPQTRDTNNPVVRLFLSSPSLSLSDRLVCNMEGQG